jgi:hypothetical protein
MLMSLLTPESPETPESFDEHPARAAINKTALIHMPHTISD